MTTLFIDILLFTSASASNCNVGSCSNDLKTAFQTLIGKNQVFVAVPKAERNMHVLNIPEIANQQCNQNLFIKIWCMPPL